MEYLNYLYTILIPFVCSFIFSGFIIYVSKFEVVNGFYDSAEGPQKVHTKVVPRIGGVGIIFAALPVSLLLFFNDTHHVFIEYTLLVISSLPVFIIGFAEDYRKNIGIKIRFFFSFISAVVVCTTLNLSIKSIDIQLLNYPFSISVVAVLFAWFCITGVTHSYNIIDGFNGLASMLGMISLLAICHLGYILNDYFLIFSTQVFLSAIFGFFVFNYPRGLIFLGDCGSYLIGFIVSSLSLFLVVNHPQVSPWFSIILNFLPIFETIFSIYRRRIYKNRNPSLADRLHLHTLVYRRMVSKNTINKPYSISSNAKASTLVWIFGILQAILASIFWNNTPALLICFIAFGIFYIFLYKALVRFKLKTFLINI